MLAHLWSFQRWLRWATLIPKAWQCMLPQNKVCFFFWLSERHCEIYIQKTKPRHPVVIFLIAFINIVLYLGYC